MVNELLETIAEALELESVGPEAKAGEPEQWDSLGHLRIILAVEERFKVRFKTDQLATLDSVAALWDAINGD
jgi:acyl carrier protein